MKYAYFNPTVFAVEDVPPELFVQFENIVNQAHEHADLNDEGEPTIGIRGGQQIQVLPNEFGIDISILKTYVESICDEYFLSTLQVNGQNELNTYKSHLVSAWTIRQHEGDYQALHSHDAHISGNIYIDVPDLAENSKVSDGCLEFKIPTIKNPGTFHFVDSWKFKPQIMKMVVFPSHVPHTVYPWKGQGCRTVLAWDVKLIK